MTRKYEICITKAENKKYLVFLSEDSNPYPKMHEQFAVLKITAPHKKEALQVMRQERGQCTQCVPAFKVSTFRRDPNIYYILYTMVGSMKPT